MWLEMNAGGRASKCANHAQNNRDVEPVTSTRDHSLKVTPEGGGASLSSAESQIDNQNNVESTLVGKPVKIWKATDK